MTDENEKRVSALRERFKRPSQPADQPAKPKGWDEEWDEFLKTDPLRGVSGEESLIREVREAWLTLHTEAFLNFRGFCGYCPCSWARCILDYANAILGEAEVNRLGDEEFEKYGQGWSDPEAWRIYSTGTDAEREALAGRMEDEFHAQSGSLD